MSEINKIRYHGTDYDIGGSGGGNEIYIGDEQDAPATTKLLIDDGDMGLVQVDTVPVGTVADFDGENIPNGWEEIEDAGEVYSAEEVRVGTWLGKPLYRKVVNLGTITVKLNSNTFNTDITDVENVITEKYTFISGGRATCYWTHIASVGYILNTNQIELWFGSEAGTVLNDFKVILEYTKTTD